MLYDFRYPFKSFYEFLNYIGDPAAFHLALGFVLFCLATILIFVNKRGDLKGFLLILFFGGALFNNYAFRFLGPLTLSDISGIFLIFFLRLSKGHLIFYISLIFLFIHAFIANFIYQLGQGILVQQFISISKIFVLFNAVYLVFKYSEAQFIDLLKNISVYVFIACFVYIFQLVIFKLGTLPYGSYSPAGWSDSPFPSFGSTSIERGHFGKIYVFYLLPLVYLYQKYEIKLFALLLYLVPNILNISASSYVIFFFSATLCLIHFSRVRALILYTFISFILSVFFLKNIYFKLFEKIYLLGILGGDEGGRSFGLVSQSLEVLPFGLGYGGSSTNYASWQILNNQINNPVTLWFSQLGYIGVVFFLIGVLAFIYLYCSGLKRSFKLKTIFPLGLLPFTILFIDYIWFSYALWLSLITIVFYKRRGI